MFEDLPIKESLAIELKYLGNTYQQISEKTGVPIGTVNGWFETEGKLFIAYTDYVKTTNRKRQEETLRQLIETDDNILTVTTNIMRQIGKKVGEDTIELNVSDYKKAWEIQRIVTNRPTDIKTQNINFDQQRIDAEAEAMRKAIEGYEPDDENQDEAVGQA